MADATRSVIIPLATNLHIAFDTELLRTHVAWEGKSLNLWGTPYHLGKDRFYCDFDGKVLWKMPQVFPWSVGEPGDQLATIASAGTRFLGVSTKGGLTTLAYELAQANGKPVTIRETPRASDRAGAVTRVFEVGPCSVDLWFLAHAGPAGTAVGQPATLNKGLALMSRDADVTLDERVWKEVKNESVVTTNHIRQKMSLQWLKIPAHASVEKFAITTTVAAGGVEFVIESGVPATPGQRSSPKIFPGDKGFILPAGDEFFRLERFPLPKEIQLQVNGMDFLPNGDLAICTWLGDVYIVEKATGAPGAAKYRRFARGLCEPAGLKVIDGDIYVVQKQQLTRLRDTDGDGEADLFECINQGWGFTGNYHSFAFGPSVDSAGNFHVFVTGNHGAYDLPYMGWDVAISRDGKTLTPFCSGLRSPDGFGSYRGDVFMTENQGNWMGACKLNHLQKGRFYGFPSTTPSPRAQFDKPTQFDPPAVWFPYGKISKSASGITEITDDRFGPFKGQLLVGEFQIATVMRVFLEKVNGEWQGCVWPFAKGFESGVNRLAYGPDGKLYVGGLKNAAWAAVAPKDYSLDRVTWTGKVPFEVKEVHARRDGFELTFTQPVDPATAGKADNWDVTQFTYEYHEKYGSPEFDFDGKPDSASSVKVASATVSADNLTLNLKIEGWRTNYVTTIRALDVTNADGKPLRNDTVYYTLNQIPR